MRRPGRSHPLAGVLWVNALALALVAAAVYQSRSGREGGQDLPGLLPLAYGQDVPPIAGGAGLYLMPGQLSSQMWGVYLMDVDRQSLMVYHFDPAKKQLNFIAARELTNDRLLGNYNTFPNPLEIRSIAEKERQRDRLPAPGNAENP